MTGLSVANVTPTRPTNGILIGFQRSPVVTCKPAYSGFFALCGVQERPA